jgi:hypothetical protein
VTGEHYVGDGCDEHVLVRRVPSVRESSARLGITMTEHNAPDIVRPAPFDDDAEWASLGNIECRCGDVFPTVEAMHDHIHLSHPNADRDDEPVDECDHPWKPYCKDCIPESAAMLEGVTCDNDTPDGPCVKWAGHHDPCNARYEEADRGVNSQAGWITPSGPLDKDPI